MGNSCSTIHESRGEYYYRRREQYLQNNDVIQLGRKYIMNYCMDSYKTYR